MITRHLPMPPDPRTALLLQDWLSGFGVGLAYDGRQLPHPVTVEWWARGCPLEITSEFRYWKRGFWCGYLHRMERTAT